MKLSELLAVCVDSVEIQVMIKGEGIIGNACMLASCMCKDVLDMTVCEVAPDDGKLEVWVDV